MSAGGGGFAGIDPGRVIFLAAHLDGAEAELERTARTIDATLASVGAASSVPGRVRAVAAWAGGWGAEARQRVARFPLVYRVLYQLLSGWLRLSEEERARRVDEQRRRQAGAALAGRFADLLEGDEVDVAGLAAACAELARHADDPIYTTALFTELGPEATAELVRLVQGASFSRHMFLAPPPELRLSDEPYAGDAVADLLRPISLALATASHHLPRAWQDALLAQPDQFAVAQLLRFRGFDAGFLVAAGRRLVVDEIVAEGRHLSSPMAGYPEWDEKLPLVPGEGPMDGKTITLAAIARNPEAATRFLTGRLAEPVAIGPYGVAGEHAGFLDIVLRGDYEDDGAALGAAVAAAVTGGGGTEHDRARIFARLLTAVPSLGDDLPPRALPGIARVAVARLDDLVRGARSTDLGRLKAEGRGVVASTAQVEAFLASLLRDGAARRVVLDGYSRWLVTAVDSHTRRLPPPVGQVDGPGSASLNWIRDLADITQVMINAQGEAIIAEGAQADARRRDLLGHLEAVIAAIPLGNAVAGLTVRTVTGSVLEGVQSDEEGDARVRAEAFSRSTMERLRVALAVGYAKTMPALDVHADAVLARYARELGVDPARLDWRLVPPDQPLTAAQQAARTRWVDEVSDRSEVETAFEELHEAAVDLERRFPG